MGQSDFHYLNVIFLKDQIQESIDVMKELQEKMAEKEKEKQWVEGYCHGLQFASELATWLTTKEDKMEE